MTTREHLWYALRYIWMLMCIRKWKILYGGTHDVVCYEIKGEIYPKNDEGPHGFKIHDHQTAFNLQWYLATQEVVTTALMWTGAIFGVMFGMAIMFVIFKWV